MSEYGEMDHVRIERVGDAVHVTLCNPEARNAQTPATWRRLASVPQLLTPEVRAVVLRGEGVSFSAGLDRRMISPEGVPGEESLLSLATYDDEQIDAFIAQAQAAFSWWHDVPQVTVALVQGHAIGAGFQLALACDVMIVADDAKLAMRETSLGLVPDLAGTAPLVSRVGYSRAFEICARGRYVEADEAVRIGLGGRPRAHGGVGRLPRRVHGTHPGGDAGRGVRAQAPARRGCDRPGPARPRACGPDPAPGRAARAARRQRLTCRSTGRPIDR